MNKKILIFGKTGQLGWELQRCLAPLGEIHSYGSSDLDLTQVDKLVKIIRVIRPSIIVNASAYTAVDRAETEHELAFAINAKAPEVMAEEARLLNAVFVHYSTDYVFDGTKSFAYSEDDQTNPLNVYGQSKLAGERSILQVGGAYIILRTSWVYSLRGDSFVTKVLSWARAHETLKIVSDQIGSPTWARMLAEVTAAMLTEGRLSLYENFYEKRGVYHLAGAGSVSRFDFAKMILKLDPRATEQVTKRLEPALTVDFPTPAQRPLVTMLDCSNFEKTFTLLIPHWEDCLRLALEL